MGLLWIQDNLGNKKRLADYLVAIDSQVGEK